MKKITVDGPFGGKNKQMLGADGKKLSTLEALKEKHRLDGKEGVNVLNEAEAHKLSKSEDYIEKVKRNLEKNKE